MKTILIIIGIMIMLTSVAYAERVMVFVDTESVYRITGEVFASTALTESIDIRESLGEGQTSIFFNLEGSQALYITLDIYDEDLFEYFDFTDEVKKPAQIVVKTSVNWMAFEEWGDFEMLFVLGE